MLLITGVTLFTSRIILNQLGVSDFGVYNLVAGIVAMLGFLNASMATATQRYLSYDIGRKDYDQLKVTFSTSLTIHFVLALFALIIAESVGLWYVNYKMVFPLERAFSVNVVYQFSILIFLFGIIQVPYNSLILARERMNIYAYVSVAEAALKLLIVYCLVVISGDKLIVLSILSFVVSFVIGLIYQVYCRKVFEESRYKFTFKKKYFSELLVYSGWNLFGNIAVVLRSQGSNILLNLFFGTLLNAAYGITLQIQSAVNMFVVNFQMALNPQIVQAYAANDLKKSRDLTFKGAKFSFHLMFLVVFPIFINTEYILELWLKLVPEYTVDFVRLCLIVILIDTISGPLMTMITAVGKIRLYHIVLGGLNVLLLPIAYYFLKFGYDGRIVFQISIIFSSISLAIRVIFLMFLINLELTLFLKTVLVRIFLVTCPFVIISVYWIHYLKADSITTLVVNSIIIIALITSSIFLLGIDNTERDFIIRKLKKQLS